MEIPKNPIECAFHVNTDKPNSICMENNLIGELKKFAINIKKITNISSNKDVITKLKQVYNCKTESCILTKREIIDTIGQTKIDEQLKNRFKPDGPLDKAKWFSNFNIDDVLRQIEKQYQKKNFKHITIQMRDFQETNSELATMDFVKEYKNGVRCFGVVFNDDTSNGSGTHWTAMFGDFSKQPFTIEHFNSSGNGPKNEVIEWMGKTKHKLKKELGGDVIVTYVSNTQHQKDNSSCGPYSLYYIISRLSGIPYTYFDENRIPDSMMWEFRKVLFRNSDSG